jgi:hypothetical protein
MRDSEIEQRVLKQLGSSPLTGCREVCVVARDGIVTLDGTVPSRRARLAIQRVARAAGGVIAVVNNLQSKPQFAESSKEARAKPELGPTPAVVQAAAAGAMSTY